MEREITVKLRNYSTIEEYEDTIFVPNDVFDIIANPFSFKVYFVMLSLRDSKDGVCYMPMNKLAKECNVSVRRFKDSIKHLTSLGLLDSVNKTMNGRTYKLFIPLMYIDNGKINKYNKDNFDNNYYVYIHINKLTNEVLYVGKGTQDRYRNLCSRNESYLEYIKELGKENIECSVIKYFKDETDAYNYEEDITNLFKSLGQARYCIKSGF